MTITMNKSKQFSSNYLQWCKTEKNIDCRYNVNYIFWLFCYFGCQESEIFRCISKCVSHFSAIRQAVCSSQMERARFLVTLLVLALLKPFLGTAWQKKNLGGVERHSFLFKTNSPSLVFTVDFFFFSKFRWKAIELKKETTPELLSECFLWRITLKTNVVQQHFC